VIRFTWRARIHKQVLFTLIKSSKLVVCDWKLDELTTISPPKPAFIGDVDTKHLLFPQVAQSLVSLRPVTGTDVDSLRNRRAQTENTQQPLL